jgi:hypothetical protein
LATLLSHPGVFGKREGARFSAGEFGAAPPVLFGREIRHQRMSSAS